MKNVDERLPGFEEQLKAKGAAKGAANRWERRHAEKLGINLKELRLGVQMGLIQKNQRRLGEESLKRIQWRLAQLKKAKPQ